MEGGMDRDVQESASRTPGAQRNPNQQYSRSNAPSYPSNDHPASTDDSFYGTESTPEDTTQSTGGSAWDRIRKQGGIPSAGSRGSNWPSGRGPPPTSTAPNAWSKSQRASGPGDGYTFSSAEEERQLAKSDAQKEFDDRVERERRGGDFTSSNGDQKRW